MKQTARIVTLALIFSVPGIASADLLGIWMSGKADMVGGTGKVYENLETGFGYGGAAGLEILGLDLWSEALIMGQEQYMFTANVGLDASFGEDWVVDIGVDSGLIVFSMEEPEQQPLVIPESFDREVCVSANDVPQGTELPPGVEIPETDAEVCMPLLPEAEREELTSTYDSLFASESNNIGKYALGWNAVRARLQVERKLVSVLFIGLGAHVGYHYMTSGEDIQAGVKDIAIDNLLQQNQELIALGNELDPPIDIGEELKAAAGARSVNTDELNGLNYNAGIYLKIDI